MAHQNLYQLLKAAAAQHPDHGLLFYLPGEVDAAGQNLRYPGLLQVARRNAHVLHSLNLEPSSIILLHFTSHVDNIVWFWSAVCAGFVPAMSTPFTNDAEQRRKHLVHLQNVLDDPICLTTRALLSQFADQDKLRIHIIENISAVPPLFEGDGRMDELIFPFDQGLLKHQTSPAALMLTSGSTGNAKAVSLTHRNIFTSLWGKSVVHSTTSETTFLNWIGADHVACLIEIHLHAVFLGADQVHVQAADLVPKPLLFLDLIEQHRVAYTFAPNFFLASLRRALDKQNESEGRLQRDLSCLHTLVTGGEANVVETCVALTKLFENCGTPSNVLCPGFGMTETCGGSIYSKDCPRRDVETNNEFATVGSSIPGVEMRIIDLNGVEVDVNRPGDVEVRGLAVFSTYHNNPKATSESFHDGWFITGDRGRVDALGQLTLTGRAKETVIINGVNYFPHEIEATLEEISGTKASYTLVFPYRQKGSPTESLCVVYFPLYEPGDIEARSAANDAISKVVMLQTSVRPYVIPLDGTILQKSTLGKLPRAKIRAAFDNGEFRHFQTSNDEAMARHRAATFEGPANETEKRILLILMEVIDMPQHELSVNTSLFVLGINSIDIIKIKQRLQQEFRNEISIITVMTHPSVRGLAQTLADPQRPHEYDPMITLQSEGFKTPLWLIHPGVGEILVFIGLATHITDRPSYAMRARGFEAGESFFSSIEEAVSTYHTRIKRVQPEGPYAIAGYSYGSMIAFEITKLFNTNGDEVKFLGAFNLPPHIKFRMRQLDWTACMLSLSHFLDLISEDYAHGTHAELANQPREVVIGRIMQVAPADRIAELGLDREKLTNWADLAYSLQSAAVDYEPAGKVQSIDVFAATPLAAVAKDMEDWKTNHLGKWADFSETEPRVHEVDGAHYTMLKPVHVRSFQKKLKVAMQARGV
ncbi:hypothetical protein MMC25_004147 [Agyrium rufum]|nr:hypothetical protein [Agyrium rufum]